MRILNTKTIQTSSRSTGAFRLTIASKGAVSFTLNCSKFLGITGGAKVSVGVDDEGEPLILLNDKDGFEIKGGSVELKKNGGFYSKALVSELERLYINTSTEDKLAKPYKSASFLIAKEPETFEGFQAHRIITRSKEIRY